MSSLDRIFISNAIHNLLLYVVVFTEQLDQTIFLLGPSIVMANLPNKIPIVGPKDPRLNEAYGNLFLQQAGFLNDFNPNVTCYGHMNNMYSPIFYNKFPFYPIATGYPELPRFEKYLTHPNARCGYAFAYDSKVAEFEKMNIKFIDLVATWNSKTQEEKNRILGVFGISDDLDSLFKKPLVVLATQPLFYDGLLSKEDHILLYKNILKNYKNEHVLIKPHPRDLIDWKALFPEHLVLDRFFPLELITLVFPIKRIATFYSSVAFSSNVNPKIVDFYSKDFKKLKMYHPETTREENGVTYRGIWYDLEEKFKKIPFNWLRIPDDTHVFYKK